MPRKDYTSFIVKDEDKIKDFLEQFSVEMYDYMEENLSSRFVMFYKFITHSDLGTFGKATMPNRHEKNYLYYIDEFEMSRIEKITDRPFQTAHQSNIGLRLDLYEIAGLPNPREFEGHKYLVNDYFDVYVNNDNLKYFSEKYTKEVFERLNKHPNGKSWDFGNLDVTLNGSQFTTIDVHCAVHGFGMEIDTEFHKLRHHLFKGDTFIMLFEFDRKDKNRLFLLFDKNPIFFNIIGQINSKYSDYQLRQQKRNISLLQNNTLRIGDEVTRKQQNVWRKKLAEEMMGYTQNGDSVMCPFTYVEASFEDLGSLFVASHIKGFSDPQTTNEEKYDINNGLLLLANADALFDKHLITIGEDKELIFSFLLDDIVLKQKLLLLNPIFKPVLNDKRMKYLEYHRSVFNQLEIERRM